MAHKKLNKKWNYKNKPFKRNYSRWNRMGSPSWFNNLWYEKPHRQNDRRAIHNIIYEKNPRFQEFYYNHRHQGIWMYW